MEKELVCIVCPKGCRLKAETPPADPAGRPQGLQISGNACPRGEAYARAELTHPTRVLTSTVRVEGAAHRRCPVKTAGAVPKGSLFEIMRALDGVTLRAPVQAGETVLADACGTGVDVVTTRGFTRIEGEGWGG